jgi:hypothetical protein
MASINVDRRFMPGFLLRALCKSVVVLEVFMIVTPSFCLGLYERVVAFDPQAVADHRQARSRHRAMLPASMNHSYRRYSLTRSTPKSEIVYSSPQAGHVT